MQLYFLTAVGWSLDSSGNLQALNTAGTLMAKFINTKISAIGNIVTAVSNSQLTTTSLTSVSTGVGVAFTAQVGTTALVGLWGLCNNNTATDGGTLEVWRTTGAIPSNGSATTGGQTASAIAYSAAISQQISLAAVMRDTGLTTGTSYNYYFGFKAVTGGTWTFIGGTNVLYVLEI